MEVAKAEVTAVLEAVKQVPQKEFRDLTDLQLAYLGGGTAEVIVA